jgi:hypothetical protein
MGLECVQIGLWTSQKLCFNRALFEHKIHHKAPGSVNDDMLFTEYAVELLVG